MYTPVLIINFKNYLEAMGEEALRLAKAAEKVASELHVNIAVAPPNPFLSTVASNVKIPVLAQHTDSSTSGSTTGWLVAEAVKKSGASGSLLNHSEHRISLDEAKRSVARLRATGLTSVVCAAEPSETTNLASCNPDYIAIEPPELIGTGIPVCKAKPEVITESVKLVSKANPSVKVITGAGIVSGEDVRIALELGTVGVLVASGIVKAKDWQSVIREMALPLR